jgi:hypothetical protein
MKTTVINNLARAIALAAMATLLLVGCGGGGSTSVGTTSSSGGAAEPSKEFQDPEGAKGPEPVATFGKESGDAEREEASAVLAKNLTAREKADFATQCETLGKRGLEVVLGKSKVAAQSKCQKELKKLAEPLAGSKEFRIDTLSGEVAALRVKGSQAYALYHGSDGQDYAMPMERESGEWKVGSIATTGLPAPSKPQSKSAPPEKKNEV